MRRGDTDQTSIPFCFFRRHGVWWGGQSGTNGAGGARVRGGVPAVSSGYPGGTYIEHLSPFVISGATESGEDKAVEDKAAQTAQEAREAVVESLRYLRVTPGGHISNISRLLSFQAPRNLVRTKR